MLNENYEINFRNIYGTIYNWLIQTDVCIIIRWIILSLFIIYSFLTTAVNMMRWANRCLLFIKIFNIATNMYHTIDVKNTGKQHKAEVGGWIRHVSVKTFTWYLIHCNPRKKQIWYCEYYVILQAANDL